MSAFSERDQALSILDLKLDKLSKVYEECYLSKGKGALLVYADRIIKGKIPGSIDYNTKEDILFVFDSPASQPVLREMLENYDAKTEGIMTLITSYSNASFFVTVKFSPDKKS